MRLPSLSPNRSRVPPPLPARPKPPPPPPCDCLPLSEVDEWLNVLDEAVTASKKSARENPKTLDIRLFTGTWNTAGKVLEDSSILGEWISPELDQNGNPPDLIAIGLQELVDLSAGNVMLDSFLDNQSRTNSQAWLSALQEFMSDYGKRHGIQYFPVTNCRLLGTYLVLFCTSHLRIHLSDIQRNHVSTGAGGRLGNKGSTAIRLRIGGTTSMSFVCSHMTAHRENLTARNDEFRQVASKLLFVDNEGSSVGDPSLTMAQRMGGLAFLSGASQDDPKSRKISNPQKNNLTVLDHDIVVWMGDLNYRIIEGVPVNAVLDLIEADNLEDLRELDQLNKERGKRTGAFSCFYEGPLSFPPTYKVVPGTGEYAIENANEKKIRCPSWCDRILWSVGMWGGDSIGRMALDRYWCRYSCPAKTVVPKDGYQTSFLLSGIYGQIYILDQLKWPPLLLVYQIWNPSVCLFIFFRLTKPPCSSLYDLQNQTKRSHDELQTQQQQPFNMFSNHNH
eukprot:104894_1